MVESFCRRIADAGGKFVSVESNMFAGNCTKKTFRSAPTGRDVIAQDGVERTQNAILGQRQDNLQALKGRNNLSRPFRAGDVLATLPGVTPLLHPRLSDCVPWGRKAESLLHKSQSLNNASDVCMNCGNATVSEIRRDELFGSGAQAVIIENIPMMKCRHCGMVYLEPKVSRMIDEICAHPERHSTIKEKLVAEYV